MMNKWVLTGLAVIVAAVIAVLAARPGARSARPVRPERSTPAAFDPAQSVAVFVGIRSFAWEGHLEVPYAVDDAVDLAYTFALDPRVSLVPAKRVILALSDGQPRKPESQRRLAQLRKEGATVAPAGLSEVLQLLRSQAGRVGPDGIFIVSFATHGFTDEGITYLLAANSFFPESATAIRAERVFEIVGESDAARSLILVDTCRERVQKGRAGPPDPRSAAPLIQEMALAQGQVVLFAAAGGKYAYDDPRLGNGVFTAAVLDGLQCRAGNDRRGLVTVDVLSQYVEQKVRTWIRDNRDPNARNATQANMDGATRGMPLSKCSAPPPKDPPELPRDTAPPPGQPPVTVTSTTASSTTEAPPPVHSSGKIPLNARYDVILAGRTVEGPFRIPGQMTIVPTANPDATDSNGEPHPLDVAIETNANAMVSGVRGSVYFFTNTRLTEFVGGAQQLKEAGVNTGSVTADGQSGYVGIRLDPESATGNPLNLMTLGSGTLAIGRQIVSGSIDLQFQDDGSVRGTMRLSTGRYASAGHVEYEAELTGRRVQ